VKLTEKYTPYTKSKTEEENLCRTIIPARPVAFPMGTPASTLLTSYALPKPRDAGKT